MNNELLDFMTWVNQNKKLGYTPIGIERIVNKYTTLKERSVNQIIDEAYENYLTNFIPPTCPPNLDVQPNYYEPMTKEWFIKSIKERGLRGEEFSEKWGLKIEERELSEGERGLLLQPYGLDPLTKEGRDIVWKENNLPTKLITITYKEQTIESYG